MEEYTEFLRKNLGERRNIDKLVFKIVGRIYKAIQNGAGEKEIDTYIATLRRVNHD